MPVLVTGAGSGLGARVVDRLLPDGGEVRAHLDATVYGDGDAVALRARGCKVVLGEPDDEGHLEAALAQVHTVAHCWGGPLDDADALIDVAATVASAALGAGVRRLVWVRELADGRGNRYLDALHEVASIFAALPIETVTLATGLHYGDDHDPLIARLRAGWLSGTGADPVAEHAPVHLDDVAAAIALADRGRGAVGELRVRLGLIGARTLPLADVLGAVGAPPLQAARPPGVSAAPEYVVDWLSRPATTWPDAIGGDPAPVVRAADGVGQVRHVRG